MIFEPTVHGDDVDAQITKRSWPVTAARSRAKVEARGEEKGFWKYQVGRRKISKFLNFYISKTHYVCLPSLYQVQTCILAL
jgi:hypothetical protein